MVNTQRRQKRGASTAVWAVIVLVVLVVAGAGGYFAGMSSVGAPSTTTQTVISTVTQSGGGGGSATTSSSASTVNSQVTVTSVATSTATVTSTGSLISQDLVNAAKAEGGTMTIYSLSPAAVTAPLQTAFQKAYPWATVNMVNIGTAADLTSRVTAESKAGKVGSDVVFETLADTIANYVSQGYVQNFSNPVMTALHYSNTSYDQNGYWYNFAVIPYGLLYNTNLVSASAAPKALTDLANPTWSGKMTYADPYRMSQSGTTFATYFYVMGNTSWTQLMNQIKANNPTYTSSGSAALQAVIAGKFSLTFAAYSDYITSKASGAPVGWTFLNPSAYSSFVAFESKGAAHPNSAKLFIEWLESEDGQLTVGQTPYFPSDSSVSQVVANAIPGNVTLLIRPEIYANINKWISTFQALFPPSA